MERVVARRDILVIAARKVIIDKKRHNYVEIKRSTFPIKAENDRNCHRGCLLIHAFMMIKIRW